MASTVTGDTNMTKPLELLNKQRELLPHIIHILGNFMENREWG